MKINTLKVVSAFPVILSAFSFTATANESALADAIERQDDRAIGQLLDQRTSVNEPQVDGMTALHWAAYHDDLDLVQKLINAGAEVNAENRYGIPPLSLAATNANSYIVKALVDAGADASKSLAGGETMLMIAARTGSLLAVDLLIDAGADVNALDDKEQTALMWSAAEGHAEIVRSLIDSGADIHHTLGSGFTPLLFAVREGNIDVALNLIEAGVDVNALLTRQRERTMRAGNNASEQPINQGLSPLLLAIRNGHFELAIELIKVGADPNDMRSGFTPLHTISWVRKPDSSDRGDPAPVGSGNLSTLEFIRDLSLIHI